MRISLLKPIVVVASCVVLAVIIGCSGSSDADDENVPASSDDRSEKIKTIDPCEIMDLGPAEQFFEFTGEYENEPSSLTIEGTQSTAECWAMISLPDFEAPTGRVADDFTATIWLEVHPYDSETEAAEGFETVGNERFNDYANGAHEYEIAGPTDVTGDWDQGQSFTASGVEDYLEERVLSLVQEGSFLVSVEIHFPNDPGIVFANNDPFGEFDANELQHFSFTLDEAATWVDSEYISQIHASVANAATLEGEL